MIEFSTWFERWRKKNSDRSWRDRHRMLLAFEVLEPRQMLAADGFGGVVPLAPAEQVCEQVCDGVTLVPFWNSGVGASDDEIGGLRDHEGPTRVYLDDVAEEVGDLFEIDEPETWWPDGE